MYHRQEEMTHFRHRYLDRVPENWRRKARIFGCVLALVTNISLINGAVLVMSQLQCSRLKDNRSICLFLDNAKTDHILPGDTKFNRDK